MNNIKAFLFVAAISVGAYSTSASAFCPISYPPLMEQVTEYYDTATDRFFLSWHEQLEQFSCTPYGPEFLNERPPTDTVPTGLYWKAFTKLELCGGVCAHARFLCRFRSETPADRPSLFVTIDENECETLKRPGSGWIYLPDHAPGQRSGSPLLAAIPVDAALGQCPIGIPVYRFFNNRSRDALPNYRYVTDELVRLEMRSRPSWTEQGIAFCVYDGQRFPIAEQSQQFERNNCDAPAYGTPSCVEAVNMPLPRELHGRFQAVAPTGLPQPAGYFERTGALTEYIASLTADVNAFEASRSFLQFYDYPDVIRGAGFFLTSADRPAGFVSNLTTKSLVASTSALSKPFPGNNDVEMDLGLFIQTFVKRIRTTGDDSQAYVHSMIVFVDGTSGKKLRVNVFAIGTPFVGDFFGADENSDVLAAFALGPSMSYGRSVGLPMLRTTRTFDAAAVWGYGGNFGYRINRGEFERMLQRARVAQPLLSADARDYRIESFGFRGEIAGTAELGFNLQNHVLTIIRP